jgi:hypothetical protein
MDATMLVQLTEAKHRHRSSQDYARRLRERVDILPSFKTPAVQVLTLYPGMPTEIMERDITNRIERWTSQSEGSLVFDLCRCCGVATLKDHVQAGHNEDG